MPLPPPPPPAEGPVRLTQFSHGAGCGCKIAPAVLETILKSDLGTFPDPRLLVGYGSRDDAAVYDLGDGRALISTTDFFSPIVDDAFDFGRIAATNALSDVYAMGGKPLLAVAILGWPVEKLPAELAARVVEGGRQACHDAGIALAGGHSIDAPEPFFGLAVTGEVSIEQLKRNDTARAGDVLILTKPIGVGILSTAQKRAVLKPEHARIASELMCRSNAVGAELAKLPEVHAMTDVTGFGLAGHLLEMCRGSGLTAEIGYDRIPVIPEAKEYLALGCYADGALRNWKSYHGGISGAGDMERMMVLSDPQTSGGLLVAVAPEGALEALHLLDRHVGMAVTIGRFTTNEGSGVMLHLA
ncbi:MAG: selenide, water dikinase SelD [Flavobacteriales bacterium]|nr:selenide, water dikinase SelD [Flavobacteriales bacterium]